MTVPNETNKSGPYFGDTVTKTFDYDFKIVDAAHLNVVRSEGGVPTTLTLDVDYTVTGVGNDEGGQIETTVAPTQLPLQSITILRDVPFDQDIDLENQGAYYPETVEMGFDLAAMRDQQLSERIDRALLLPPEGTGPFSLPMPEAGKVLGWKADGSGLQNMEYPAGAAAAEAEASAVAAAEALSDVQELATEVANNAAIAAAAASVVEASTFAPQGRPTLLSGVAVPTSDIAGATSIYWTPAGGLAVPLFDGVNTGMVKVPGELSLALDPTAAHAGYHQTGKCFDIWLCYDGGTVRFGTGPAWTSDTVRSAALELKNGFWTNAAAMTLRYGVNAGDTVVVPANRALLVGSFRATANGAVDDSRQRRMLSPVYNAVPRAVLGPLNNSGNQYTYSAAVLRQANGDAGQMIETMQCRAGRFNETSIEAYVANSTATARAPIVGIGVNSVTGVSSPVLGGIICTNTIVGYPSAKFIGALREGYSYIAWLEQGVGVDVQTWLPGSRRMVGWLIN